MDQSKKYPKPEAQVQYRGRWVSRSHFRVYVYNGKEQKLAKSYDEYSQLIASGEWFDEKLKPKKLVLEGEKKKGQPAKMA